MARTKVWLVSLVCLAGACRAWEVRADLWASTDVAISPACQVNCCDDLRSFWATSAAEVYEPFEVDASIVEGIASQTGFPDDVDSAGPPSQARDEPTESLLLNVSTRSGTPGKCARSSAHFGGTVLSTVETSLGSSCVGGLSVQLFHIGHGASTPGRPPGRRQAASHHPAKGRGGAHGVVPTGRVHRDPRGLGGAGRTVVRRRPVTPSLCEIPRCRLGDIAGRVTERIRCGRRRTAFRSPGAPGGRVRLSGEECSDRGSSDPTWSLVARHRDQNPTDPPSSTTGVTVPPPSPTSTPASS